MAHVVRRASRRAGDRGAAGGGRFATVGALIDHIFLVERRHLQRLRGTAPDNQTGLSGRHAPPLFDYGASVRRELDQFVAELDDDVADEPRTFTVQTGDFVLTPRKLLFHCLLHETRHWAQIALRSAAPASSRRATTTCSSAALEIGHESPQINTDKHR